LTVSQNRLARQVAAKYPFLNSFPFKEFSIEVNEMNLLAMAEPEHEEESTGTAMIKFSTDDPLKGHLAIVIFEQELKWIHAVADKVTDLDKISKKLEKGIKSKDLIVKRNAVDAAEVWCKALENDRARLSYSTLGDALMRMIKDHRQLTQVISKIMTLSKREGLVSLTKDEHHIILSYYHFQLIYTKLILGLIIASKISL
jgi:hypothetical protein